jgi:hypothetical protein
MYQHTRFILLGLCLTAAPAFANQYADKLAEFTTDLSIPASPAAAHVGLSLESVLAPRTRREFDVGISKALTSGADKPTLTLEVSPYYMLQGGKMQFTEYRDNFAFRTGTKTTVGLALGNRKEGGTTLRVTGLSLTSVPIDLSDPMYSHSLQECINRVQKASLERAKKPKSAGSGASTAFPEKDVAIPFKPEDARADTESTKQYQACIASREAELWNRTRVSLGIATGRGHETTGALRKVDFGNAAFVSAQYGFESLAKLKRVLGGSGERYLDCANPQKDAPCYEEVGRLEQNALLTLHLRKTMGRSDLDIARTGPFQKEDSTLAAVRFTYGSAQRSLFLETSRLTVKGPAATNRTDLFAYGASARVGAGTWLNVVSGRRKNFVDGRLENVVELNIQFGATNDPIVAPAK